MKKILILLLVAVSFTACKKGWSKKDKDDFTVSCVNAAKAGMTEEKAKSYCSCMLDKLQVKYPTTESAKNINAGDPVMTEMAKDCMK